MAEESIVVGKIDELGRIVLPVGTRRSLGWEVRDELEIIQNIQMGEIKLRLVRKPTDVRCVFCRAEPIDGATAYINETTTIAICHDCVDRIKK